MRNIAMQQQVSHGFPTTPTNQPTNVNPLLISLSWVRILPHAAVQVKKETHLGALTCQILFPQQYLHKAPYKKIERQTCRFQLIDTTSYDTQLPMGGESK